jgi:hypothetical protein
VTGYNFELDLPPVVGLFRDGLIESILSQGKRQRLNVTVTSRGYKLCVEIDPASEKAVAYEAAIRAWIQDHV